MKHGYTLQKVTRLGQSLLLAAVMVYLTVRAVSMLFGPIGGGVAIVIASLAALKQLRSQRLALPKGSQRITWFDSPEIIATIRLLSDRGQLPFVPQIVRVPHLVPIALTTGVGEGATIVVSDGLLRILSPRELRGVIAHEIAHMRNRDLPLFAVFDAMQGLTRFVAVTLSVLVVASLPMLIAGHVVVPPTTLLYLSMVPLLTIVLQFAFLRTREYQADLGAVELTDDPEGLATALEKMEDPQRGGLWALLQSTAGGGRRSTTSNSAAIFRTHPPTEERVRRLRAAG